jgi:hypothetical protein
MGSAVVAQAASSSAAAADGNAGTAAVGSSSSSSSVELPAELAALLLLAVKHLACLAQVSRKLN